GYVLRLSLQLYDNGNPAIGSTRRTMYETLMQHLNAIVNSDGRYRWTPTGGSDDRILDGLRLLEYPDPKVVAQTLKAVTFALDTRYPYGLDFTQTTTTVTGTQNVTNDGNVPFYPVIHVPGAAT